MLFQSECNTQFLKLFNLHYKQTLSWCPQSPFSCAGQRGRARAIQPLFMVKAKLQGKATANKPALYCRCPLRKGGTGRRDRAGAWTSIEGMSSCSPGQFACSNINCYWKCLIWLRVESQRGRSLCSWRGGSGAFAPNLVMLKDCWYWVNNANSTQQFSLLSMFIYFYMCIFTEQWHNGCCIWKIYRNASAHLFG